MHSVTQANSMVDVLMSIDSGQRSLLLIVALGCAVGLVLGVVGIISTAYGSIQRTRAETQLKQEMLERGMGAEEIATVIKASGKEG